MWNLSRAGYYADWITIPILGYIAVQTDVCYRGGPTLDWFAMFAFGCLLWTALEYGIHRWVFHRLYRREHWIHHIAPARFIGVPPWQTGLGAGVALTLMLAADIHLGSALFCGLAAGYGLYIWAHDKFHHGSTKPGTYWARRERDHAVHHTKGIEANFGVATPLWDVLLGTHKPQA